MVDRKALGNRIRIRAFEWSYQRRAGHSSPATTYRSLNARLAMLEPSSSHRKSHRQRLLLLLLPPPHPPLLILLFFLLLVSRDRCPLKLCTYIHPTSGTSFTEKVSPRKAAAPAAVKRVQTDSISPVPGGLTNEPTERNSVGPCTRGIEK